MICVLALLLRLDYQQGWLHDFLVKESRNRTERAGSKSAAATSPHGNERWLKT